MQVKTDLGNFEAECAAWLENITESETLHFMVNVFENATAKNYNLTDHPFKFKTAWAYEFELAGSEAKKCINDWFLMHFKTADHQGEFFKIMMAYRSDKALNRIVGCGEINLNKEKGRRLMANYELIAACQKNAKYSPPPLVDSILLLPPFIKE